MNINNNDTNRNGAGFVKESLRTRKSLCAVFAFLLIPPLPIICLQSHFADLHLKREREREQGVVGGKGSLANSPVTDDIDMHCLT